jgi:predicted lipid-binding transport protein (Tim44 family)
MKKLLLLTFLLMFACQSMSFAAISGSKGVSAPRSAPSTSLQPAANSSSSYKPSAPAASYSNTAPTAAQSQQSTGSSFLRNAGLFGGGMLLGSLFGGMFGAGSSGMFSQIIGMFFNALAIALLFMAARYGWNRFQESRKPKSTKYWR